MSTPLKSKDFDWRSPTVSFFQMIPDMREAAFKLGYCLALHGSVRRDLDIIAIPWTEEAASASDLVSAMLEAVQGYCTPHADEPYRKPHGRLVWCIHLGHGGNYIDFGVMPRSQDAIKEPCPAPEKSSEKDLAEP